MKNIVWITFGFGLACAWGQNTVATLDATQALHEFDGFGGLSAGASSRLLWDYPEPHRSAILDYLFKPNFGAGLTMNKVEIGGSTASTDGAEPTISLNRTDLDCSRGYENWLLAEGKKRNPNVLSYGLSWGVPQWIGNGSYYSEDNIAYHVQWLKCVKEQTGILVDYIGVWNERAVSVEDLDWVVRFRNAMDAEGFENTKIVIPDGHGVPTDLLQAMSQNETQRKAVSAIGLHYPCNEPMPETDALGLKAWASEDYSSSASTWASGGSVWGRLLVQNYVRMNMTATIAWATIWSVYPNLVCQENGLTRAMEPWSGHYDVDSAIWTSAHLGQFVQPGWYFLTVASSGSGSLNGGGDYVTLVDSKENPTQFVVIIETLEDGKCGPTTPAKAVQNITIRLGQGMPQPASQGMALWRTTNASQFQMIASGLHFDSSGILSVQIEPHAMYTLTSHPGSQQKGTPSTPIPPSKPFPFPYSESFETPGASGTYNQLLPLYFSDMYGTWEVHHGRFPPPPASGAGTGLLVQVLLQEPTSNSWLGNADPLAMSGDVSWTDYKFSAWGFLPSQTATKNPITGGNTPISLVDCATPAIKSQTWFNNTPETRYLQNALDQQCLNIDGCGGAGSSIIVYECITSGNTCPNSGTDNLQWYLANGQLTSPLNGLCITYQNNNLVLDTCSSSNTWTYLPSKQLQHDQSKLCLSVPEPKRYVQVCGRISSLSGFRLTMDAYCLQANSTTASLVLFSESDPLQTILATYPITSSSWKPVSGGSWIQLGLSFNKSTITPLINNEPLTPVTNTAIASGNIAVGSGWHSSAFDLVSVTKN